MLTEKQILLVIRELINPRSEHMQTIPYVLQCYEKNKTTTACILGSSE